MVSRDEWMLLGGAAAALLLGRLAQRGGIGIFPLATQTDTAGTIEVGQAVAQYDIVEWLIRNWNTGATIATVCSGISDCDAAGGQQFDVPAGEEYQMDVTVENTGNADGEARVRFLRDGSVVHETNCVAHDEGQQTTYQAPPPASSDGYTPPSSGTDSWDIQVDRC